MPMTWPPQLADLKADLRIADTRDDQALEAQLEAAVAFVETVHDGRYNFADDPLVDLRAVPGTMPLGALRLAGRWYTRRRSPDALIQMGDLGAARVPSFDIDIDRMLKIGRFAPAVVA